MSINEKHTNHLFKKDWRWDYAGIRAGYHELDNPYGLQSFTYVEAVKDGAYKPADVVIIDKLGRGKHSFFIGDGVSSVKKPKDVLRRLYEKVGRYDAFIPELMKRMDVSVRHGLLMQPGGQNLFLSEVESFVKTTYIDNGVEICDEDKSSMAMLVGALVMVDQEKVTVTSFGDINCCGVDQFGTIQDLNFHQNTRIDELTIEKINKIMDKHNIKSVSEAKQHLDFRRWLEQTYTLKINKPGGVTAINGYDFDVNEHVSTMKIPIDWLSSVVIATDGFTMGAQDKHKALYELTKLKGEGLVNYILTIIDRQKSNYKENMCIQEKPTDDMAMVVLNFPISNIAYNFGKAFI